MILVIGIAGVLIGSLLYWLGDALPYWAKARQVAGATRPPYQGPALLRLLIAAVRRPARLNAQSGYAIMVEAAYTLTIVSLWQRFGLSTAFLLDAAIIAILLVIALVDFKYRLVLNFVTYPAFIGCLFFQLGRGDLTNALVGGVFALAIFGATALVQPGKLGGGDIKLAVVLGVAFGFPGVLWVLIIGTVAGAVAGFILFARSRQKTFAYAPYLCLGAAFSLFYNPFLLG